MKYDTPVSGQDDADDGVWRTDIPDDRKLTHLKKAIRITSECRQNVIMDWRLSDTSDDRKAF